MNSYSFTWENEIYQNTKIKPFNRLDGIFIFYSALDSITDLNSNKLDKKKSNLNKRNQI